MKGALDSLGVRPKERRAVILMLMAFFLIGNIIWLVFEVPTLTDAQSKRDKYLRENKKNQKLKGKLADQRTLVDSLRGDKAQLATSSAQAQKLMKLVERQALTSGLNITRSRGGPPSRRRDQDFEEFKRIISFYGGLLELTNFLKSMSEEQSMIRISNMNIQPTTDRRQLKVDLTFVASYPKPETESEPKKK